MGGVAVKEEESELKTLQRWFIFVALFTERCHVSCLSWQVTRARTARRKQGAIQKTASLWETLLAHVARSMLRALCCVLFFNNILSLIFSAVGWRLSPF